MTSSNGNIFRVTGHLCGEFIGPGDFPTQRPVTRSFDVYFGLRPNKWLSKQSWGWWFETLSCSLWRHRNGKEWTINMEIFKSGWILQCIGIWNIIFLSTIRNWSCNIMWCAMFSPNHTLWQIQYAHGDVFFSIVMLFFTETVVWMYQWCSLERYG